MASKLYSKTRPLNPGQQFLAMKADFPQFKGKLGRNSSVRWVGEVAPFGISETYTVSIEYELRGRPRVTVLRPKLQTRAGKHAPHIFSDGTLCLHLPGEWCPEQTISSTIIPWLCEWLFFYEIWVATGTWHGGGSEHAANRKRK